MRFAILALALAFLGRSTVEANPLEIRACSSKHASALIKANKYASFCTKLLRSTRTKTATATVFTDAVGETVTIISTPVVTTGATILSVSTSVVLTTVSVTSTTTVSNTLPVQTNARAAMQARAAYTARPTKPARVSNCAYKTLSKACTHFITRGLPRVTATTTNTITTGTAALPVTIVQPGDPLTITTFSTSTIFATTTATATSSITAQETFPAFLAFKDFSNSALVRELEFSSDAGKKGKLVSTNFKATAFTFQATAGTAGGNAAANGLVSGLLTSGSGAMQQCLVGGTTDLALATCDGTTQSFAAIFTANPTYQFSVNPTFFYVYSGVFPAELHAIVADTTFYKFVANSPPPAAGTFGTLFLSNSNATGF